MQVLLVEDSSTLANLFRVQLRQLGHDLTIAATKKEAMAAFEDTTFDLVFIDPGLEGTQDKGLEILAEVKASNPAQRIGIVSSNDWGDLIRFSREHGAEFYMVKPFTLEGLKVVLSGDKQAVQTYQGSLSEGRIISF
jgi:DNA-binding response OmpR family regulator